MPPIGTQTQTTVSYCYNSADLPHDNSGLLYPKNCFGAEKHRNLDEDDLRVVRWTQWSILADTSSHMVNESWNDEWAIRSKGTPVAVPKHVFYHFLLSTYAEKEAAFIC